MDTSQDDLSGLAELLGVPKTVAPKAADVPDDPAEFATWLLQTRSNLSIFDTTLNELFVTDSESGIGQQLTGIVVAGAAGDYNFDLAIARRLYDEATGLGSLGKWWRERTTQAIYVDSPGTAWASSPDGRHLVETSCSTPDELMQLATLLTRNLTVSRSASGVTEWSLPGGGRITQWVSADRSEVAFAMLKGWQNPTVGNLIESKFFSNEMAAFCKKSLRARASLLITTPKNGAGQALAAALLSTIPRERRIVTVGSATIGANTHPNLRHVSTPDPADLRVLESLLSWQPDYAVFEIDSPMAAYAAGEFRNSGISVIGVAPASPVGPLHTVGTFLLDYCGGDYVLAINTAATAFDALIAVTRDPFSSYVKELRTINPIQGNNPKLDQLFDTKRGPEGLTFSSGALINQATPLAQKILLLEKHDSTNAVGE